MQINKIKNNFKNKMFARRTFPRKKHQSFVSKQSETEISLAYYYKVGAMPKIKSKTKHAGCYCIILDRILFDQNYKQKILKHAKYVEKMKKKKFFIYVISFFIFF